jgi:hypothetical protein
MHLSQVPKKNVLQQEICRRASDADRSAKMACTQKIHCTQIGCSIFTNKMEIDDCPTNLFIERPLNSHLPIFG